MKRFICILLMLLVSAFMIIGNVSAVELVVFGPEQYERTRGKPNLYIDDFQCSPSIGKLIIKNGDENGKNRIADAEIEINGSLLLGSDHFNPRVYVIELPVDLDEDNSISVKLAGKPGSFLTVQIVQTVQDVEKSTLPDTGQITCYNDVGNIIDPCPSSGETFYGQDANYDINTQSYTKLGYNGVEELDDPRHVDEGGEWMMTKDDVTGLIWEVKNNKNGVMDYTNPNDADNTYTWYDSNPETNGGSEGTPGNGTDTEGFIAALNNDNFGGFNDWRMPTVKELSFIRHLEGYGPAINEDYFPNTMSAFYWSSTTDSSSTGYAWRVFFSSGYVDILYKSFSYYVRAVRSGQ